MPALVRVMQRLIIRVSSYSPDELREYAMVPSIVDTPTFSKKYDDLAEQRPASWPERFDLSCWTFFTAMDDDASRVGGAAVILRCPEVELLEGRDDLALLWDLRVAPERRRRGVGRALVDAVERWARGAGAHELKVETQDLNAGACRFYERLGFRLSAVNPRAYVEFPDETQMIYTKTL